MSKTVRWFFQWFSLLVARSVSQWCFPRWQNIKLFSLCHKIIFKANYSAQKSFSIWLPELCWLPWICLNQPFYYSENLYLVLIIITSSVLLCREMIFSSARTILHCGAHLFTRRQDTFHSAQHNYHNTCQHNTVQRNTFQHKYHNTFQSAQHNYQNTRFKP